MEINKLLTEKIKLSNTSSIKFTQPKELKWWHDATTYQIWIRSFYDSNGDGYGDFKGISEKLNYLEELGINSILLSPIFESPSYHGYDASDFYKVESDYGTMSDFESLLKNAKLRNIKVIIDLAVNHVSENHPWFLKSLEKDPLYDDYFIWKEQLPEQNGTAWLNENNPQAVWHKKEKRDDWYYAVFGWTQPDLNYKNPMVVEELKKLTKFWLDKGIDGFRLDAIRYVIEEESENQQADTSSNKKFLVDFTAYIKSINPEAVLIGEVAANTQTIGQYYQGNNSIDTAFDFALVDKLTQLFAPRSVYLDSGNPERSIDHESLKQDIWQVLSNRSRTTAPSHFFSSFQSNHDSNRLASYFDKEDGNQLRILSSLFLTAPFSPYIYYGEEIAMQQKDTSDVVYQRALMQWDGSPNAGFNSTGKRWLDNKKWFWYGDFSPWWEKYWSSIENREMQTVHFQKRNKNSLLNHYKNLISIRKSDNVLKFPDKLDLFKSTGNAWVVRYSQGDKYRWVIVNLDSENKYELSLPDELNGNFHELYRDTAKKLSNTLILNPADILILK